MRREEWITFTVVLTIVLAFSLGMPITTMGAAPPNDDIFDATEVTVLPFTDVIDTTQARTSRYDLSSCGYEPAFTVWYKFTPIKTGFVRFSTLDSSYSTLVTIYTGTVEKRNVNLTEQYCTIATQFDITLNSDTTYYIRISSYTSSPYADPSPLATGGTLRLSITEVEGPANDDFASATSFVLSESQSFYDGNDNTFATVEAGEPSTNCSYGRYRTLWYQFTPAANGRVTGSYGGYSPFMVVYTGSSFSDLSQVWCSAYGGGVDFAVVGGTTYYIQLGENYEWSAGWAYVNLSFRLPPANDNFANAKSFILGENQPFSDGNDNTYATVEAGEPFTNCSINIGFRTLWYQFTPAADGRVTGNYGGSPYLFMAVYTGSSFGNLSPVWCSAYGGGVDFAVVGGTTYYIQLGEIYNWWSGWAYINLSFRISPPNDNFLNAIDIVGLPYEYSVDNLAATKEPGEPKPSCIGGDPQRTVWFTFTPTEAKAFTIENSHSWWWSFMAVYTGDTLDNLTELSCRSDYWGFLITFKAEPGKKYYFQLGSPDLYSYGTTNFKLMETPPPNASFWYWPWDPTIFEDVNFINDSNDPYEMGISATRWDLGDGTVSEEWNPVHRYTNDGEYTVNLEVFTSDGRSASASQTISVKTHDVAITKFSVPQSASVNQSRTITVGLRNTRYPETVTVELYKSTPYGWQYVGTLVQSVPIRPSNRTTDFLFRYTFTSVDASMTKVTFRAVAIIQGYRDALPLDNEAISLPVKVNK